MDEEAAKREKAEALNNSRPLYMWRLTDHPEAKAAVDHIYQELISADLVSKRFAKKWRGATRALVLDLCIAYQTDPMMYIGYSRDPNKYKVGSVYGAFFLSGTILVNIVDYLKDHGYIEHEGFLHDKLNPARSRTSRMRATSKLIEIVRDQHKVTLPMIKHNHEEQVIILRNADKKDIEYEDTPEVIRMRENLQLINRRLENHAILLKLKEPELIKLQSRLNRKLNFADKRLRRVFNNQSWDQGGRFYGGWWQNVPRAYRNHIRINDKHVVECDFSGLHINMLYAMDKLPMPEGDVYNLPGYSNDATFRSFVKRMLLIMVNSENRDKTRKALHSEVHFERTLELPTEIPSTGGGDLYPLMDAFAAKHEPIKHYFNTGVGIDLQNIDAKIVEKVLLHFSSYAVLPMHDSFIIHQGLEAELREVMNGAFEDMFGVRCEVDLKYSSLDEALKQPPGRDVNERTFHEMADELNAYTTYETLLQEHWRLQAAQSAGGGPDTSDS